MTETTRVIDTSLGQNLYALLRGRRSIRYYRSEMPSAEIIERILISAAMAPSAHNRQPWRYFVVTDDDLKKRLANVMGARLAADRRRDGDAEGDVQLDIARSFRRITGAPVIVLVAMTLVEMDSYPDPARARAEYLMAVQSTAMATQNLLLAAYAEGLGTCWMCAPLFCPLEVQRELGIPEDWHLQGLLTVGYPERPGKLRKRKPLPQFVVFADSFGKKDRT